MNGPVVVGVDGSDEAIAAVAWAADEAATRRVPLRVVTATLRPLVRMPAGHYPIQYQQPLLTETVRLLDRAELAARSRQPSLPVSGEAVPTTPTDLLVSESRHAELVVTGARGAGGFAGLLVGSVTAVLVNFAHCPVAVVRRPVGGGAAGGSAGPTGGVADGPVVVGVDGGRTGAPALDFAFAAADRAGTALVALHTWSDVPVSAPRTAPGWAVDWEQVRADEERLLAESLAGYQQEHPDVTVERVVAHDRPVRALLARAAQARLLVVGTHGRGGFPGMLLGSTSHALLHHCPCPLVVVRGR
ncbi:MAG TPA: universal stress protein [Pseudonocardiaceae bacterium]